MGSVASTLRGVTAGTPTVVGATAALWTYFIVQVRRTRTQKQKKEGTEARQAMPLARKLLEDGGAAAAAILGWISTGTLFYANHCGWTVPEARPPPRAS